MTQPSAKRTLRLGLWSIALLSVAVLALGCDASTPTAPRFDPWPAGQARLSMISGDNQVGTAGRPLGSPFVVRVVDRHGAPISGAVVLWDILEGGGDLPDVPKGPEKAFHETKTDAGGTSSVVLTLGPQPGQNVVESRVMFGYGNATFTARGMAHR